MKIFNTDFLIDLQKCILWQYDNAPSLKSLINQKQTWYKNNVTDFIEAFKTNVFNINTANDFGLNIWGKILNFSRYITYATGVVHYCTTEEYRFLLKAQVLKFKMRCTVPEINKFCKILFEDTANQCYVLDNKNMTITYMLQKDFSDKQWLISWLLDPAQKYTDFLPRPAGVEALISTGYTGYFGFEGSGIEGFDNGIFLN